MEIEPHFFCTSGSVKPEMPREWTKAQQEGNDTAFALGLKKNKKGARHRHLSTALERAPT